MSSAAYEGRRRVVSGLLGDGAALAAKAGQGELSSSLEGSRRHLDEGRLYVMVCGEFKRGKSSLINALLDDPGLVPVDVDIATNAVSMVSYGEVERIVVYLDDDVGDGRVISRSELPDYVVEGRNRGNRAGTRFVTIEVPNSKLRSGLTLVDTPGVGGLSEAHNAVTYSFLSNADAVLFVGDVVQPLSSKELEFAKLVAERCGAMVVVLTKADLEDEPETMVANTRRKLSDVLNQPAAELTIVPVSSELKLHWLESGDEADLEESNFVELERALWDRLAARAGEMLIVRALGELELGMSALALPLRAEREAYAERNQAELANLEEEFGRLEARLQELNERRADWRLDLARGLEDIRSNLEEETERQFREMRDTVEHEYLADDRLVNNPAEIAQRLNQAIALLLGDLGSEFDERASALIDDVRATTGLQLAKFAGSRLSGALGDQIAERIARIGEIKVTTSPKAIGVLRTSNFAASPAWKFGAVIGGLLGTLAGGFVAQGAAAGAAIGKAVGHWFGAKQELTQIQERDLERARMQILRAAGQVISDAERQMHAALRRSERDFERFAGDELGRQLKTELDAVAGASQALGDARRRSQQDAQRRTMEIEAALGPIERILDACTRLREQAPVAGELERPGVAAGERVDLEG